MKINGNQKSVLILFAVMLVGLLVSGANVMSIEAVVGGIILGCWFDGVRDKAKPN